MTSALWTARAWALILSFPLLASCGGGGGGGGGTGGIGTTGNNYPLQITTTPSSLTGPLVQGVSRLFSVSAQVSGSASTGSTVYVVIDDTSGVVQPDKVQLTASSITSYTAELITSTTLPVGEDKGNINVRVCSDIGCSTVYGATTLPYDFTVASATNTTGVSALSGVVDWQTERGTPSQTSYVPVTLDPSRFTVRWLQSNMEQLVPDQDATAGLSMVTDSVDQLVIVSIPALYDFNTHHGSAGGLIAYSEIDGTPVWHTAFTDSGGNPLNAGPLAISNGIVYTTQEVGPPLGAGTGGDMSFVGLNAKTGAVMFQTQIADTFSFNLLDSINKGCTPGSPVTNGTVVYVNPGCIPDESGTSVVLPVAAFDATTGQSLWTGAAPGGNLGASFLLDGSDLYYITPRAVSATSLTDLYQTSGAIHSQTTLPDDFLGYGYLTPALDGTGGAILPANTTNGPMIERYDLTSGQQIWQFTQTSPLSGSFQAMAVANGVIYVASGVEDIQAPGVSATVTAYNVTDGVGGWTWSPPASDFGTIINAMIVTNNLLFASTDKGVYAVDLSTHKTVWTLPVPGFHMAISPSGMLYIGSATEISIVSGGFDTSAQAVIAVNLH